MSITIQTTEQEIIFTDQTQNPVQISGGTTEVIVSPVGAQGPPGNDTFRYVHDQVTPETTWTISHALDGRPNITCVNVSGEKIYPEIDYVDDNNVLIRHAMQIAGQVYFS